ncbi:MAG: ribosomal protein S18-alanine N-acetyltransferase [Neisseria sp.]|uniref:ribosomal protein S18-alanine N-acetyltransferase n=1 Tax=Neisseria sp. TaxID=192066 RepID=UPI0026DD3258|nr:ribosomal protein S18-alanine N-acetyltransferase [Neisseria sp.]MDO4641482.1 ribosomal protein S18-alanine N-acetyltransferase [Neisseria sp.]
MQIRPAVADDCATLAAIDQAGNPSPWSTAQFASALQNRYDRILVAQEANEITAFIVWHTLFETSELHLIATTPTHRGRGIASMLMAEWFQTGIAQNVTRYYLEVRAGNTAAQALYRKHGFIETGRRRAYYSQPNGSREDALIMEKLC